MTVPSASQGHSALDLAALSAISGTQQLLHGYPRMPLSKEEREEAQEAIKDSGICRFCAGIHAGLSSPACPRLAAGKVNGDGDVVEFSFWKDGEWDTSRVVFVADIESEDEETE